MTATKPDLRVRAVGDASRGTYDPRDGHTLVLCEMPSMSAAGRVRGDEFDLCTPGFVPSVTRALVTAGIPASGGAGVAALHRRTTALAQAVQSIGRVLSETTKDAKAVAETVDGDYARTDILARGMGSISEMIEGVAADVFIVDQGKAARATLAAHGWAEGMPGAWSHKNGLGHFSVTDGGWDPDELRAFATLAEECSQP
jgi:hypothetical protein